MASGQWGLNPKAIVEGVGIDRKGGVLHGSLVLTPSEEREDGEDRMGGVLQGSLAITPSEEPEDEELEDGEPEDEELEDGEKGFEEEEPEDEELEDGETGFVEEKVLKFLDERLEFFDDFDDFLVEDILGERDSGLHLMSVDPKLTLERSRKM